MAHSYNPYNKTGSMNASIETGGFFNRRLLNLSMFGRNYEEAAVRNSKGIHKYEDTSVVTDSSGYQYSLFSRKVHALMLERHNIASLNSDYIYKYAILREYATKGEIRDAVTKLANEIVVYNKNKKFCELADLPEKYSEIQKKKMKEIFERTYVLLGFGNGSYGWDLCRDWLVEGYICKEIVRDKKGKEIKGFITLDPRTLYPYVDPQNGIKYWIQNPTGKEGDRRIFLDAEIIYISYSGSSNYMETSYVEPLIRPYNELKMVERTKILFNLINSMMHKQVIIPTAGLSPTQAEQEVLTFISDYKDHIQFDDTTGQIFIDGSKDLPWSKEYFMPKDENGQSPEVSIIKPEGHDLNEDTMLIWFRNNFKYATKFPLTRFDSTVGGGNIYSYGAEVSHDDYNFGKFVGRLRAIYKEILLKPICQEMILEFPELQQDEFFLNDLDIIFYGNSEIEKAKELANMQAKAAIANDLQNNFKRADGQPFLHPMLIAKRVMELSDELLAENDTYWKEDTTAGAGSEGGEGGTTTAGTTETPTAETTTETGTETAGTEETTPPTT